MMNKVGSGNKGLDWVIIGGMIAAFPKTADLLSFWTPQWLNDLFGMDMSFWYGAFCAAMVEGTILFLHFDRRARWVGSAQAVKWVMIGISFACQIFDGFVNTETVNQMPEQLRVVLTYAIPALPLIIAVMVTTINLPDELPEEKPRTRVGLKHRLPDLRKIWEGEENTVLPPQTPAKLSEQLRTSPNGEHEEDFTLRQR